MATATPSTTTARYKAAYKKVPGTLFVTDSTVGWAPDVAHAETVRTQQLTRLISMFTSKAGSAKVSLKLSFIDDIPVGGLLFVFTSSKSLTSAMEDRQSVQDRLIPHVARNKGLPSTLPPQQEISTAIAGAGIGHVGATTAERRVGSDAMDLDGQAEESTHGSRAAASVIQAINAQAGPSTSTSASPRPPPPITRNGTPAPTGGNGEARPTSDMIDLRKKVLSKNPQLKMLHKELVMGRFVKESEFWEGREHLIQQEALISQQQPGRSSQLLDDRFGFSSSVPGAAGRKSAPQGGTGFGMAKSKSTNPDSSSFNKTQEDDTLKIKVTAELQREVFEEFPIVQRIYAENVGVGMGEEMSETDFWTRYFRSALWERHRASTRKADSGSFRRADPVFDSYLEEPDDDLEPRNAPGRSVDMFLDLAATEEDHGETGNTRDVTMQAGKKKDTLPLIRRFNEHSNRLVAQDEDTSSAALIAEGENAENRLYSEIDYEDLRGPEKEQVWELDMRNGEGAFDERGGGGKEGEKEETEVWLGERTRQEIDDVIAEQDRLLVSYKPDLPNVTPNPTFADEAGMHDSERQFRQETWSRHKKDAEDALKGVVGEVLAGGESLIEKEPIPEVVMSQILTCHSAATEFLRQFWSAALPSPPGALNPQTPEQKLARAKKMAKYLEGTQAKVEGVVKVAEGMKAGDPNRVREALAPTLAAVKKALAHFASTRQ